MRCATRVRSRPRASECSRRGRGRAHATPLDQAGFSKVSLWCTISSLTPLPKCSTLHWTQRCGKPSIHRNANRRLRRRAQAEVLFPSSQPFQCHVDCSVELLARERYRRPRGRIQRFSRFQEVLCVFRREGELHRVVQSTVDFQSRHCGRVQDKVGALQRNVMAVPEKKFRWSLRNSSLNSFNAEIFENTFLNSTIG